MDQLFAIEAQLRAGAAQLFAIEAQLQTGVAQLFAIGAQLQAGADQLIAIGAQLQTSAGSKNQEGLYFVGFIPYLVISEKQIHKHKKE